MSRTLVVTARALIGIHAVLFVWSLANAFRGQTGVVDLLFYFCAVCSAWGAYKSCRWAVVPFFLITLLSAFGLLAVLISAGFLLGEAFSKAGFGVWLLATVAVGCLQIAAWFQFKAYWTSLGPKPPGGTRLTRDSRAP
ncbi:MAG TPA: hypothetical protein VKT78_12110 [Fimbriimonadaceae bacterium]|nr:hypothetical protein [Fimbriimonadaceae bacterium]